MLCRVMLCLSLVRIMDNLFLLPALVFVEGLLKNHDHLTLGFSLLPLQSQNRQILLTYYICYAEYQWLLLIFIWQANTYSGGHKLYGNVHIFDLPVVDVS